MIRTKYRQVRDYQMLRSAHLERAAAQTPASMLYVQERFGVDPALRAGLDLIRAGTVRADGASQSLPPAAAVHVAER